MKKFFAIIYLSFCLFLACFFALPTFAADTITKEGKVTDTFTPTPASGAQNQVIPTPNISDIKTIGSQIFGFIYNISTILAVIMVVYGGYKYITSQGNPDQIKDARTIIVSSLSGLILLIVAKYLLTINEKGFINPTSLIPFVGN